MGGGVAGAALALALARTGSRLTDLPALLSFYGPAASGVAAALAVAIVLRFVLQLPDSEGAGRGVVGSLVGWLIGFSIGWAIGLALGGFLGAALGAATAGALSYGVFPRIPRIGPPESEQPGLSRPTTADTSGGNRPPQLLPVALVVALVGVVISFYPLRATLPDSLLAGPVTGSKELGAVLAVATLAWILVGGALAGRRAPSPESGAGRGAVVGGLTGAAIYGVSGFLVAGLLAADPIVTRLGGSFANISERDAVLVQVMFRLLWMQPAAAGIFVTAASGLAAVGGALAATAPGPAWPPSISLDGWRSLASSAVTASGLVLIAFAAMALLPPAIREVAYRAGSTPPLNSPNALDWLPSAWPFLTVLVVMAFAVLATRARLPELPEEARSVAWQATITATVPWFAIYPAWHLASGSIPAVLLAAGATLLSYYLLAFAWRTAFRAGGFRQQLRFGTLPATAKSSLVAALVGAISATPAVGLAVLAQAVVLPLWGSLLPAGAVPLRAPIASYLARAYRDQSGALLVTVAVLWLLTFAGAWLGRPLVRVARWGLVPLTEPVHDPKATAQGG